jgi:hypothetical protein
MVHNRAERTVCKETWLLLAREQKSIAQKRLLLVVDIPVMHTSRTAVHTTQPPISRQCAQHLRVRLFLA